MKIPTVLSADELLDVAFRAANNEGRAALAKGGIRTVRVKRAEGARVKTVAMVILKHFNKILDGIKMEGLSPFYYDLLDVVVGVEKLNEARRDLGTMTGRIERLASAYERNIRMSRKIEEIYRFRKEFYGKVASLLRKTNKTLIFLIEAKGRLKEFPSIEDTFTVVIAGPPNVGKSTFLRSITTAEPRVESYPFTTQSILLGYFERDYEKYQVVDTPGLLDRPLAKRNPIERQAALALKHLANVVVFIFDPTETCGFSVDAQLNVFREISGAFDKEVVPVVNKADLLSQEQIEKFLAALGREAYICSAQEKKGVEEVVKKIVEIRSMPQRQ